MISSRRVNSFKNSLVKHWEENTLGVRIIELIVPTMNVVPTNGRASNR